MIVLVPFLLGLALFTWSLSRDQDRRSMDWKKVTDGVLSHVVYGDYTVSKRSGAMVHTTRTIRMDVTVVFFTDGRSYVLNDRQDMPFPAGTNIEIWVNGLGQRRVKKAS